MWKERLLILLSSLGRGQILSIGLFIVGFVLLSGGLIYSLNSSAGSKEDVTFTPASQNVAPQESKITVDVEGAVIKPGVYSLNSSARVKDALIATGGLSSDADRGWVAKNLNLALKLSDSMKIYIPFQGDNKVQGTTSSIGGSLISSLININSATLSELDSLPGIGPVTAQKIVDGRPYSSINDLLSKKILKSSVFEKIKDKITY